MEGCLLPFATLEENLGSLPNPYIALLILCNSSPKRSNILFLPLWVSQAHGEYICISIKAKHTKQINILKKVYKVYISVYLRYAIFIILEYKSPL